MNQAALAAGGRVGEGDAGCFESFLAARMAISAGDSPARDVKLAEMRRRCKGDRFLSRMFAVLGYADPALERLEAYYAAPEWRTRTVLYFPEMAACAPIRVPDPRSQLGLTQYWTATGHWLDFCFDRLAPVDCKALAALAGAYASAR